MGIFIIIGTAGASDLERLDLSEVLSSVVLSLGLILFGRVGLALIKTKRACICKKMKKHKSTPVRQAKVA